MRYAIDEQFSSYLIRKIMIESMYTHTLRKLAMVNALFKPPWPATSRSPVYDPCQTTTGFSFVLVFFFSFVFFFFFCIRVIIFWPVSYFDHVWLWDITVFSELLHILGYRYHYINTYTNLYYTLLYSFRTVNFAFVIVKINFKIYLSGNCSRYFRICMPMFYYVYYMLEPYIT